jgi:hypothetical protein
MTGSFGPTCARGVKLPNAPDLGLLLVRTDYSNDRAWHDALAVATAIYEADPFERLGAVLQPVESPELSSLTPEKLVALAREDYLSDIAGCRRADDARIRP